MICVKRIIWSFFVAVEQQQENGVNGPIIVPFRCKMRCQPPAKLHICNNFLCAKC